MSGVISVGVPPPQCSRDSRTPGASRAFMHAISAFRIST